jgi:hypothetical protein
MVVQPTSSGHWRLAFYAVIIMICVGALGLVVRFFRDRADPGLDEALNGKTIEQFIGELGEPSHREPVSVKEISDPEARERHLKATNQNRRDQSKQVLIAEWYRSGDELPTTLQITVWFRWTDGKWLAFHNDRRYCWAGL